MPPLAKSSRRILVRITAVIIALLAVCAALLGGILTPYFLSAHVAETSLLTLLAVATFGAIVWLGMRLCGALWQTKWGLGR
jgi:hypothetical protein